MRSTTRMLADEHELLERLLSWLEALLARARKRDELDASSMASLVAFFEAMVDGLHQDKEEHILFPGLRQRATPEILEKVELLFREHQDERRRLEAMRASLEGAAYGEPISLDTFLISARAYLELQREHLRAENDWLLPLIESVLTDEDDQRLSAGFRGLERTRGLRFRHTARNELNKLEARFGQLPLSAELEPSQHLRAG